LVEKIEQQYKDEVAKLRKENANLRKRLDRAKDEAERRTIYLTAANKRKVLAAFHPDGEIDPERKKRLEEAFKIFSALRIHEIKPAAPDAGEE